MSLFYKDGIGIICYSKVDQNMEITDNETCL